MAEIELAPNVKQTVPLLNVTDMGASLRFYVEGLGFTMTKAWKPDGEKVRWCWLEHGGAGLMLQQYQPGQRPAGALAAGVAFCFMCDDALAIYRAARSRGLSPSRPTVGNGLWEVGFDDPDGYHLEFESPTDLPEDTEFDEAKHGEVGRYSLRGVFSRLRLM